MRQIPLVAFLSLLAAAVSAFGQGQIHPLDSAAIYLASVDVSVTIATSTSGQSSGSTGLEQDAGRSAIATGCGTTFSSATPRAFLIQSYSCSPLCECLTSQTTIVSTSIDVQIE